MWTNLKQRYHPSDMVTNFASWIGPIFVLGCCSALRRSDLVRIVHWIKLSILNCFEIVSKRLLLEVIEDWISLFFNNTIVQNKKLNLYYRIRSERLRYNQMSIQSQVLNILKNLWPVFKQKLSDLSKYRKSKNQLFSELCREWSILQQSIFTKLFEPMNTRALPVKANKGMSTKY